MSERMYKTISFGLFLNLLMTKMETDWCIHQLKVSKFPNIYILFKTIQLNHSCTQHQAFNIFLFFFLNVSVKLLIKILLTKETKRFSTELLFQRWLKEEKEEKNISPRQM